MEQAVFISYLVRKYSVLFPKYIFSTSFILGLKWLPIKDVYNTDGMIYRFVSLVLKYEDTSGGVSTHRFGLTYYSVILRLRICKFKKFNTTIDHMIDYMLQIFSFCC